MDWQSPFLHGKRVWSSPQVFLVVVLPVADKGFCPFLLTNGAPKVDLVAESAQSQNHVSATEECLQSILANLMILVEVL
jgi:hypothetical protein